MPIASPLDELTVKLTRVQRDTTLDVVVAEYMAARRRAETAETPAFRKHHESIAARLSDIALRLERA